MPVGTRVTRRWYASTLNPAALPGCVLAHLWPSAVVYTTDGGSTVAGVGDAVGRLVAAAGPDGVQTSSGLRGVRRADGVELDAADDRLDLASAVSLTGDFTIYLTGTVVARPWLPLARNGVVGDLAAVNAYSDGQLYVFGDTSNDHASAAWSQTGAVLVRIRRASGVLKLAATGLAETTLAKPTGDLTANCVGARPQYLQWNGSASNRYRDRLVYSRDTVEDGSGHDGLIRAHLAGQGYAL